MNEFDSLIRSERVVTPAGIGPATVGIRGGRIESVTEHGAVQPARQHIDLGKVALLPGVWTWVPVCMFRVGPWRSPTNG